MPHEPITGTTIPAPPLGFPVVLRVGLGVMAFVVLFVLPPCASSPQLDLTVLGGLSLWAGGALVRAVRWSGRRRPPVVLPPRVGSPSAGVADAPDGRG